MKKNLIIFLLIILISFLGFFIYNEYFTPTYAQPNYSSQKKTSSVKCQNYQVKTKVLEYLKGYNRKNNGLHKWWTAELHHVEYDFDITKSGNTFIAEVSVLRTYFGQSSRTIVGTFTYICSNAGKLTLSSAFGIFDD
jgi:uncharacterized protein YxeA|tara:strand:+ start:102 stop:512 length:411 start_codon:yes stop_codon:yes gene_type:complete